jgi:hypothetical protein
MADNVKYFEHPSGAALIATRQQVGGEHIQRVIIAFGDDPENLEDMGPSNPMPVITDPEGPVNEAFSRFLIEGGGDNDAANDYSITPETFSLEPGSGEVLKVKTLTIVLHGASGFEPSEYSSLGAPLPNGIEVILEDGGGTILDLTDGFPVTTNAEWMMRSPDFNFHTESGAGNNLLQVTWDFSRFGVPIRIVGASGEKLSIVLNDDFSGMFQHLFMAHGFIEDSEYN